MIRAKCWTMEETYNLIQDFLVLRLKSLRYTAGYGLSTKNYCDHHSNSSVYSDCNPLLLNEKRVKLTKNTICIIIATTFKLHPTIRSNGKNNSANAAVIVASEKAPTNPPVK